MTHRVEGYDFIRSAAILVVFVGHVLAERSSDETVLLVVHTLSPGITMSLLGFLSACLLAGRDHDPGTFLVKRFTRIYVSLLLCLALVLCVHAGLGRKVITQHALLHLMGLTALFELFGVENKATIGGGLWFISAILLMYLVLPFLQRLFRHRRGLLHLVMFVAAVTALTLVMHGGASACNVAISFALGVYFGVHGLTQRLAGVGLMWPLLGAVGLIAVTALALSGVLPDQVRDLLYALHPLAFFPLLLAAARRLPSPVLAASGFFAGLSYEFYILHFYLIGDGFEDFFPASTPLVGQIPISFAATLVVAYAMSRGAAWLRVRLDRYLLAA